MPVLRPTAIAHRLGALIALARARGGGVAVYVALATPILIGMAAFAVESGLGHVRKTQLQIASDASALAGARALRTGANVNDTAIQLANANIPANLVALNAGTGVLTAGDVTTGRWAAPNGGGAAVFTAGGSPANAVRTTTRMTAANGNAVSFSLARVLGINGVDITATSIAFSVSTCTSEPASWQQPNILPTLTRVVTNGNFDGLGGTVYQMTPDGRPIVRIDNSFVGAATIVITSNNRGNFTFNVPNQGQFFVVLPTVVTAPAGTFTTVLRVLSSPGARSGGTATWVNNTRVAATSSIVGTVICTSGGSVVQAKVSN